MPLEQTTVTILSHLIHPFYTFSNHLALANISPSSYQSVVPSEHKLENISLIRIKRESPLSLSNRWHMMKNEMFSYLVQWYTNCILRNVMGFVFWNIFLNAEKLSKPDTYPRFVKLAKNIVSHSLSKTSFCSVRVFRKPHFRFLNVYIRCLWTTIVYFAIF